MGDPRSGDPGAGPDSCEPPGPEGLVPGVPCSPGGAGTGSRTMGRWPPEHWVGTGCLSWRLRPLPSAGPGLPLAPLCPSREIPAVTQALHTDLGARQLWSGSPILSPLCGTPSRCTSGASVSPCASGFTSPVGLRGPRFGSWRRFWLKLGERGLCHPWLLSASPSTRARVQGRWL